MPKHQRETDCLSRPRTAGRRPASPRAASLRPGRPRPAATSAAPLRSTPRRPGSNAPAMALYLPRAGVYRPRERGLAGTSTESLADRGDPRRGPGSLRPRARWARMRRNREGPNVRPVQPDVVLAHPPRLSRGDRGGATSRPRRPAGAPRRAPRRRRSDVAFNTANLVARVSGYRFELSRWMDQHNQTIAATDEAAWRAICQEIAAAGLRGGRGLGSPRRPRVARRGEGARGGSGSSTSTA